MHVGFRQYSFLISPNAAKAFKIPVVKRTKTVASNDASGQENITEGLCTLPLGSSFGNHRFYDSDDNAFKVISTSNDYDCLIPAWYLEKHKALGTTTSHLHCPYCGPQCFGHGKMHPKYSITYDKRVALNNDTIHTGSLVQSTMSMLHKLPKQYHTFLLLFDPAHTEKFPDRRGDEQ